MQFYVLQVDDATLDVPRVVTLMENLRDVRGLGEAVNLNSFSVRGCHKP